MFTYHTQRSIMRSYIDNIDKIFKSQDLDVQSQTAGLVFMYSRLIKRYGE